MRLFILIIAAVGGLACLWRSEPLPSSQIADPTSVWLRLLTAKGGLDRLRTISSFAISLDEKSSAGWARTDVVGNGRQEFVSILPDRVWRASDYRPATMGLTVEVWNRVQQKYWRAQDEQPPIEATWNADTEGGMDSRLEELQLLYFGETSTLRPVPVGATVKAGGIELELRTAHFASVVYSIDPDTFLPVSISLRPLLGVETGTPRPARFTVKYEIGAHQVVNDFKVPRLFRGQGTATVLINPPFKSALFESPPTGILGADTWRSFLIR